MFAYELEGLKRLNIQAIKWGSSYRVNVRGRTGKMVYVSNVSRPINQRLVAKQYNVSTETLERHLSPDYKDDPKYRFYNRNHMESHLYEGVEATDFYYKLENVLSTQASAFKVNVALGYELVSKTDPDDTRYFYPNLANTHVFNNPIAINSKANIQTKVISEIRSMELADKLNYPALADSLTEEVRCFGNDDPKMLLTDMFKYIGDVSVKIQQYNVNKYKSLLQKIINAHGLTVMEILGVNLGKTYKMSDVEGWIEQGKYASFFDFHSSLDFGKQRSDYGKLKQQLDQVPVFGFNSGRYDINLIKKDLFAVIGTDNIKSVIKNPSYMCTATSDMKMLDISNYVPAGTSYHKYLTTYLGGCKCDDKIDVSVVLVRVFSLTIRVGAANAFQFPAKRMRGYKNQDAKAKRKFGMTLEHLNKLLQKQKYLCGICYCQLTADTASADRINNNLVHIDGNILISCVKCNSARKDMSLGGFRYKKLLEFNSDRLVYSIDREEKDIYAKMKSNIAGGPSIIFNRYAKRNETKIRGGRITAAALGFRGVELGEMHCATDQEIKEACGQEHTHH
ncbi:unnamed protein product [Phytophthora lilii]|uniref:Unnamed protein product n=1 Tax=Phytophthora lilii TaxID=2077276 RepID=A0A9W6XG15_9STRA|nr:unnamed protein product [Phytophthora lilii]